MQDIRKVMCWIFAATSLLHLTISLRAILYIIRYHDTLPLPRSMLITASFSVTLATLAGVAWWTVWKGKPSAKGWAISASLMSILLFLWQFIFPLQPVWYHYSHFASLVIGIDGLAAFLNPYSQHASTKKTNQSSACQ